MAFFKVLCLAATVAVAMADRRPFSSSFNSVGRPRSGRQQGAPVTGGIDFTGCQTDPETGFCCIEKEESVTSIQKDPILECTHKNVEKCHYTYVTLFESAQEEVCEENFEKTCQVTFKQQAFNETVRKCYKPLEKVCNGQGPEECRTVYESSCTTRYIEKQPGKFVGDTSCEKLPIEICGAGCVTEEGPEECHDKTIASLVDVPEEVCDLNPQKTCRFQTKLVPSLKPKHECTIIPQETCNLRFSSPQQVEKPLKTKWCQDPTPAAPGETYDESNAVAPPVTQAPIINFPTPAPETATESLPEAQTLPTYETPAVQPPALYSADNIRSGRTFVPFQQALPQQPRRQGRQQFRQQPRRQGRNFGQRVSNQRNPFTSVNVPGRNSFSNFRNFRNRNNA